MKFDEFAKIQWPARADCADCRELSMPPRTGVRPELKWRHDGVLKVRPPVHSLVIGDGWTRARRPSPAAPLVHRCFWRPRLFCCGDEFSTP